MTNSRYQPINLATVGPEGQTSQLCAACCERRGIVELKTIAFIGGDHVCDDCKTVVKLGKAPWPPTRMRPAIGVITPAALRNVKLRP